MNPRCKFIMRRWSFTARELLVIDGNHMSIVGTPLIDVRDEDKDRLDVNHDFNKDIIVEEDVWIGARVTLCAGAHINRGSIVAAGAVVTKEFPPYCICGGIPAKFIKFKWSIDDIIMHESKLYSKDERYSRQQLEVFFSEYNK
ncbi:MAG: acyltransferase [Bacteroidales bacterium]|nr:acyltransferase [Bacteroidales bacterium]